MSRLLSTSLTAALMFIAPALVFAEPQSPPVHTPSTPSLAAANTPESERSQWYGWQNIAVVGPSALMLMLARADGSGHTMGWLLIPGYVGAAFGSPVVHWSHGHVAKGFLSLGLAGASMVAFGALLPRGCDPDADARDNGQSACQFNSKALVPQGVPIGALVALAADAAFLSYDTVAPAHSTVTPSHSALSPYFSASDRGVAAGIGGQF